MRLPPLNALRAFESAARHGGYIAAADELHVTRGAISRHIKLLEDHLGVPLFHRRTSGVELTPAGAHLLPILTRAFQDIAQGAAEARDTGDDLRIICPPGTSIRWLLPRLGQFRAAHPEIQLQITTAFTELTPYDTTRYDLGFSVETYRDRPSGVVVEPLMPILVSPACAPSLLAKGPPLTAPEDLNQYNILHEGDVTEDWRDWIEMLGLTEVDIDRGDRFQNIDMTITAAVLGEGIMMADLVLCQAELSSGALTLPFPNLIARSKFGRFALLGDRSSWNDPKIATFRDWVIAEAQAETQRLQPYLTKL